MKKILLSIIFAHITTLGFSQQTYMPDDYLENLFESAPYGPFNNDNYVSTTTLANFSTIIISTYSQNHIELGLAIWIYFFNINANMAFNDVIKLMAYKIIGNIIMSDELKKFFAFLNIKHLSDKS